MKRYLILLMGLLLFACEDNSGNDDDTLLCEEGTVLENGECVEDLQSAYAYSLSFNNPNPRGAESFLVGGWKIEAFCANCVEAISAQEAPNRRGLYSFVGPDLTGNKETLVLHGIHPCFDEFQITVTLELGKTLNWTVTRNDMLCTDLYEMQCDHITNEFLYEAAEHYLNTTPNVDSCCSRYPNTTQQVCLICPDFNADVCTTEEYVGLIGSDCVCVGLDTEPRNYEVQETTPPPVQSGYARCNVDINNDGLFNDYCICKDGTGSYLEVCAYDLDPSLYSPPDTYGYGADVDHCLCITL